MFPVSPSIFAVFKTHHKTFHTNNIYTYVNSTFCFEYQISSCQVKRKELWIRKTKAFTRKYYTCGEYQPLHCWLHDTVLMHINWLLQHTKKTTQRWLKFSNFRLQNLKVALISRFQVVHICQGQMKFSISKDSLSAPRANGIPLSSLPSFSCSMKTMETTSSLKDLRNLEFDEKTI